MVSSLPLLQCLTDTATRFCIEMNSARTRQTATGSLFRAVSTYAADVPIIIVATKMDQFHAIQRYQAEERFAASTEDQAELSRRCKAYATEQLQERMLLVEQEMQEVGRFDGCVCVAKGIVFAIYISLHSE